MPENDEQSFQSSSVKTVLLSVKQHFIAAAAFSGVLNILMLSGSLFMLQVYDRVLPGHSLATLQALVVLIVVIYALTAVLEYIRSRVFSRIGRYVDLHLRDAVFDRNLKIGLVNGKGSGGSVFRDLDQVRTFLASGGPAALFDLPWMPLYVILLFLLHPYIGALGVVGIFVLTALTWLTDRATKEHQAAATQQSSEANAVADAARHSAETIVPLGMAEALKRRWSEKNLLAGASVVRNSDVSGSFGAISRFVRMSLQSLVLALGAYLVIQGDATGGVMIAASILLGRALAPIELAIGHWKGFVAARQAYGRLEENLSEAAAPLQVQLPKPNRNVSVSGLYMAAPTESQLLLQNVAFTLEAGDALGVVGPSGSGKSTLVRALVGVWPIARGAVRLDGSPLDQWSGSDVGSFLGYLPQAVDLFAGTIGENISRFDPAARSEAILKAAELAGVDQLIRSMEKGFETDVGPGGHKLSAGQRQRIALARALYGDPFLVVLDEPNSALDAEGEFALLRAISSVRQRGGIAIIVAHRPNVLQTANKALVLADGQQKAFGPRDEIFKRAPAPAAKEGVL